MPAAALNPLIDRISAPPIPAVQAWGRAYHGRHGALIDLSQAVPGYPPHPDMLRWLGEASSDPDFAGYGPIEGDVWLREAYAAEAARVYGAPISAANVHLTAGCNQAFVATIMALAGAGDGVLLTNPFYFNHDSSLAMLGIATRTVDCRPELGFLPEPRSVEIAIREHDVRALALVSPNNPTGAVYPPDLLAELFAVCRRAGIWLVLDETYRDFIADAGAPHRLFSIPDWEQTFVSLYSFSKSYCIPGHRMGAITAGPGLVEAIAKIMDNLQICAPRPPQGALAKAIPALAEWREGNRREIARRTTALRSAFDGLPGFEIVAVGAYFAYVRHPFTGRSSTEVAERLAKEAGVLTIPGEFFGPGQEDYLRFAFANADVAGIGLLRQRLEEFGSSLPADGERMPAGR